MDSIDYRLMGQTVDKNEIQWIVYSLQFENSSWPGPLGLGNIYPLVIAWKIDCISSHCTFRDHTPAPLSTQQQYSCPSSQFILFLEQIMHGCKIYSLFTLMRNKIWHRRPKVNIFYEVWRILNFTYYSL